MDRKDLDIILKRGEGYKIEFKEGLSGLDREMVAFANALGGKILVGVSDDGKIKGVKISNRLKSQVQDIANNCRPRIKVLFDELGNVLVVNVQEGEDKPHECSGGFYKRVGTNSQKMTRDEIFDFFKSEGKIRFDELIELKFIHPKDFDRGKLLKFLGLAGISKSTKTEAILSNLDVAEKQKGRLLFNKAGVLFFAKEPQRFIPWSVYTVALFKDLNGVDVIDRKEITGSLFEIVEQVMDFVKLYSKVAYKFTGAPKRENIYEYPFEAIREAVINSVMHKDYFEHGHNNILKFFPDRIQIENIWAKPRKFFLGRTIFRRNQLIADLFSRIHYGEKIGSGMQRMKDICKAEEAPNPRVEYTDTHFYTTFNPSRAYLKMAEKTEGKVKGKVVEKVGETGEKTREITREKIISLIKGNPKITTTKLAEKTGLSLKGIEWNIKSLKENGLLHRIGPDKGGYWEVVKKPFLIRKGRRLPK